MKAFVLINKIFESLSFAHSYDSYHALGSTRIDYIFDHLLMHLNDNLDFHQTSLWPKPRICMLLPWAFQNGNSTYAIPFVGCVEQANITQ
jgi:hypothetical protein